MLNANARRHLARRALRAHRAGMHWSRAPALVGIQAPSRNASVLSEWPASDPGMQTNVQRMTNLKEPRNTSSQQHGRPSNQPHHPYIPLFQEQQDLYSSPWGPDATPPGYNPEIPHRYFSGLPGVLHGTDDDEEDDFEAAARKRAQQNMERRDNAEEARVDMEQRLTGETNRMAPEDAATAHFSEADKVGTTNTGPQKHTPKYPEDYVPYTKAIRDVPDPSANVKGLTSVVNVMKRFKDNFSLSSISPFSFSRPPVVPTHFKKSDDPHAPEDDPSARKFHTAAGSRFSTTQAPSFHSTHPLVPAAEPPSQEIPGTTDIQRSTRPFRNTYYSDDGEDDFPHYLPQYTRTHSSRPIEHGEHIGEDSTRLRPFVNPSTRYDKKIADKDDTLIHAADTASRSDSQHGSSGFDNVDGSGSAGGASSTSGSDASGHFGSTSGGGSSSESSSGQQPWAMKHRSGGFELAVGWSDITHLDATDLHSNVPGYTHRGQFSEPRGKDGRSYNAIQFRKEVPESPGASRKTQGETGGDADQDADELWEWSMLRRILPKASTVGPSKGEMSSPASGAVYVHAPMPPRSARGSEEAREATESAMSTERSRGGMPSNRRELRLRRRKQTRESEEGQETTSSKPHVRNIYLHHNYYKPNEKGQQLAKRTLHPEALVQMGIDPYTRPLYRQDPLRSDAPISAGSATTADAEPSMYATATPRHTGSPEGGSDTVTKATVRAKATPVYSARMTSSRGATRGDVQAFSDMGGDIRADIGKEWDMPVYKPSTWLNAGHNEAYHANIDDQVTNYDAWLTGDLLSTAFGPESTAPSYTEQHDTSHSQGVKEAGSPSSSWQPGIEDTAEYEHGHPQQREGARVPRMEPEQKERHSAGISYGTLHLQTPENLWNPEKVKEREMRAREDRDSGMTGFVPEDTSSVRSEELQGMQGKGEGKSDKSTRNTNLFVTDGTSVYLVANLDNLDIPERGRYD